MSNLLVVNVHQSLETRSIDRLVKESLCQGFLFVERLTQEYDSGFNCFDLTGEILLTVSVQGSVIGIGGLNRDPYFNDLQVGRLRHLYVGSSWRRQGVGRLIVTQIIYEATKNFKLLTLRTNTLVADRFYQKLGFKTHPSWEHTTHHLQLSEREYYPQIYQPSWLRLNLVPDKSQHYLLCSLSTDSGVLFLIINGTPVLTSGGFVL
jgi:GNAT superfamily N-acetyltransferase